MENPYDKLYKQIDMAKFPFGYSPDYLLWRTSKVKKELAKFIKHDGKVLDIGGGFGIMAQFLLNFVDRRNYFNLDISIEMLKYSTYSNILADAEQIPCPDNFFDYAIMSEALEHVNNKVRVLTECWRVLKPKGLFLLSTPRTGWIDDFRRSIFLPFLIGDVILNKIHQSNQSFKMPEGVKDEPSDEHWLKETLESVGLTVLEQYRADNHVPWRKAGESKFWRWFADKFVDSKKFGHCTIIICTK